MKTMMASLTVVMSVMASSTFAASSDFYLQIKGSAGGKDSVQTLSCPNGVCTAPTLAASSYVLTLVDATGKPVPLDKTQYECSVKSPRDAASGLATGKRQYKPMVITKEMSSSTLVTTEADSNVVFTCVSSSSTTVATEATAVPLKASYDLKANKK
jgi:hypothetical protein